MTGRREPRRSRSTPSIAASWRAAGGQQVTNLALAERVGLSPPACLRRVRRLRDEQVVVKDVAIVDPAKVGQSIVAFVGVELDRQREDVLAGFERKMSREAEVQQCYFVSGETDYLLVVACRDMEAYNEFAAACLPTSTTSSASAPASTCRG